MDRNFARSLALVLKSEGGWSDNPADPGGATMKGVTLANFRTYVQANATKDDLRNITDAQLATVYRRFYWDAVLGAELPDGVDYATFDFAVNSGPGRAAKYLQDVVGATQDGKVGPATIAAVKEKLAANVINDLCDARLAFLHRLPTWGTFGKGWNDRVKSVRAQSLNMAAAGALVPAMPAQPAQAAPAPIPAPQPDPAAVPVAREPQPLPPKPSRPVGVGVGAIGLISVLAIYWHELVAWIHHLL